MPIEMEFCHKPKPKKGKFEDAGEGNAFGRKMHSIATYNRHQSMLISRSCTVGKFPLNWETFNSYLILCVTEIHFLLNFKHKL